MGGGEVLGGEQSEKCFPRFFLLGLDENLDGEVSRDGSSELFYYNLKSEIVEPIRDHHAVCGGGEVDVNCGNRFFVGWNCILNYFRKWSLF